MAPGRGTAARLPVVLLTLLVCRPGGAGAQEPELRPDPSEPVRVFLDCPRWLCDFDYLRRELPFVTWVRDRQVADVHLLVTEEDTGGGGNLVTLDFIGRARFAGLERRLTVFTDPTQAEAEEREALVRTMSLGLVNYAAGTGAARGLRVSYEGEAAGEGEPAGPAADPWSRWVFDVHLGGSFEGEARLTSVSLNGGMSANRTTPAWKIDVGVGGGYNERRFDVGEEEEFVTVQRRWRLEGLAVRSVGTRWSVGGQASLRHSSRLNQDLTLRLGPALEYNVFPYAESSRRRLTFLYALSAESFDFTEPTVFGEGSATRSSQALNVSLDVNEPWGEMELAVEGSHFLGEVQQNRLTMSGRVELQLVGGLSFDVSASASRIRDQIYLPAEEASEEEILVGEREFATEFETGLRMGLSYTFGSIYSDVVNPRFEALAGRGERIRF